MLKKCLYLLLVLCILFFISNTVFASDLVMDLNTRDTTNSQEESVDNTIYGSETSSGDEILSSENEDSLTSGISVSNDYDIESSEELSISNMINIVLIVVGVVLILLGIAIILKLK